MVDQRRPLGGEPGGEIAAERAADHVAGTAERLLDELAGERREPFHRLHLGVRAGAVEPRHDRDVQLEGFRQLIETFVQRTPPAGCRYTTGRPSPAPK